MAAVRRAPPSHGGWWARASPPCEPESNLSHHARLARIAFQRVAIPLRGIRRGLVGALQEIEQRLVGIGDRSHGIVGQDELAECFAEERRSGRTFAARNPDGSG